MDTLDFIIRDTNNTTLLWKEAAQENIPPSSAAKKIDDAMLDWMRELTKTLRLWTDKGAKMTSGELILARANLGAIVESWLKFFYCAYNEDYQKQPKTTKDRKGNIVTIEPNDLGFDQLKQYSRGILYQKNDSWEQWVDSVQKKRNAIHSFNYREIGTSEEYYDDVEKLYDFMQLINDRLPPVEDYIQKYPVGYQRPEPFVVREKIKRVYGF